MPYSTFIILLTSIILFIIIISVVIFYLLKRTASNSDKKATDDQLPVVGEETNLATSYLPTLYFQLRLSFIKALGQLKSHVGDRDYLYKIPWFLTIGESGSGKTTLLSNTNVSLPLGNPIEITRNDNILNWYFFNKAVVLDLKGSLTLNSDNFSDQGQWNTFIKLLKKYRIRRPLEGIILTIPSTDLINSKVKDIDLTNLRGKANSLYNSLWQAQIKLGMKLPIYVIVTKCDQLYGFKSFCQELSDELQNNMLGWSNPYSLETAYNSNWNKEAFDSLHKNLYRTQMEIFSSKPEFLDRDGLFIFPKLIESLKEPLQIYLDTIFKPSAYHEQFYFRGIYFCGDSNIDFQRQKQLVTPILTDTDNVATSDNQLALPNPDIETTALENVTRENSAKQKGFSVSLIAGEEVAKKIVFLRDLFEKKIFPEDVLAQPIAKNLLSNNRTIFVCQISLLIVFLIGGLGLFWGYSSLSESFEQITKLLSYVKYDLTQVNKLRENEKRYEQKEVKAETLRGVAVRNIKDSEQHLDDFFSNVLSKNFSSVFVPSSWFSNVKSDTADGMKDIFQYSIFESMRIELDRKSYMLVNETQPENVESFVSDVKELIRIRNKYEQISQPGEGSFEDLNEIMSYLGFSRIFPSSDAKDISILYLEAFKRAKGKKLRFRESDLKRQSVDIVAKLVEDLYRKSFNLSKDDKQNDDFVTYEYFQDINETSYLLLNGDLDWLSSATFPNKSSFSGLPISSVVNDLREILKALQKEDFMKELLPDFRANRNFTQRGRLIWQTEALEEAISLYQSYEDFINKFDNSAEKIKDTSQEIAINKLITNIQSLIKQAQRFEPISQSTNGLNSDITAEVNSLKNAQNLLGDLLVITNKLAMEDTLRQKLTQQINYLISAATEEVINNKPYLVKTNSFNWWDGDKPISLAAFQVNSPEELEEYLISRRKEIAFLARDVFFVVTAFAKNNDLVIENKINSTINWEDIINQLNKYDNKNPNNSLTALENFIRKEMDQISLQDCSLPVNENRNNTDFFGRIRNTLRRQLYSRCETLAEINLANRYNRIKASFDEKLADKFPFVDNVNLIGSSASPEEIIAFFQVLDNEGKNLSTALQLNNKFTDSSRNKVIKFLDELADVRKVFAIFLDKKQSPFFDLVVEFRVNREREIAGNQVIDWNLEVGKQQINLSDVEKSVRWKYGDKIRLSMRWAIDSPYLPVSARKAKVKDVNAVFEYLDSWSLFSLLYQQLADQADLEQSVYTEPYVLKFLVNTARNEKIALKDDPIAGGLTKAYVRVKLLNTGKDAKEAITLPKFPNVAPSLDLISK